MIKIVTDSACDLSLETAEENGVEIVPLTVRFGDQEFVDRREISPSQFWSMMAASATLPETSAPPPALFEKAYRSAAADGFERVISVHISSKLSATISSAQLAAKAVESTIPVEIVDSRFVSSALGSMVLEAARLAKQNEDAPAIISHAEEMAQSSHLYAALDTLENLKKGGRISGAQAFVGSLLSIKPIITVADGLVEAESKQRTRSRALRYLADKVKTFGAVQHLTVMQGAASDAEELVALLSETSPETKIRAEEVGAVIGTHTGPGVIGVTFTVEK